MSNRKRFTHNMRQFRSFESLESRYCLSAFGFAQHELDAFYNPKAFAAVDVDGDNDEDLVFSLGHTLAWSENRSGAIDLRERSVISVTSSEVVHLTSIDADADGDQDILIVQRDQLVWLENSDGRGNFKSLHPVADLSGFSIEVTPGDVDHDGDTDLLVFDRSLRWLENIGDGAFSTHALSSDFFSGTWSDLDADGDLDLVTRKNDQVVWLEFDPGVGRFQSEKLVTEEGYQARVAAGDLDNDGDNDLVVQTFSSIAWHANINGKGQFAEGDPIARILLDFGNQILIADHDGDNDLDLFVEMYTPDSNYFTHYENRDGKGNFRKHPEDIFRYTGVRVGLSDIDGDGSQELLASDGLGGLLQLRHGKDEFEFLFRDFGAIESAEMVHLDSDGDLDLLTTTVSHQCENSHPTASCFSEIFWRENTDGRGTMSGSQVILSIEGIIRDTIAVDLDSDGELDIMAALQQPHRDSRQIVWMRNHGNAQFEPPEEMIQIDRHDRFHAIDIDGDRDEDLVIIGTQGEISWHANTGGVFAERQTLISQDRHWSNFAFSDIDNDGDLDLVAYNWMEGTVAWSENANAQFGGWRDIAMLDRQLSVQFELTDLDNDSDPELIIVKRVSNDKNELMLVENLSENEIGQFGPAVTIDFASKQFGKLRVLDVEGDGDLDITVDSVSQLTWHENQQGSFAAGRPLTPKGWRPRVAFGDLDDDGDIDIFSGQNWLENRPIGDANNDGVFNSSDLVTVFQSGEFEDSLAGNSSFREGDWNSDGDFDINDLILAFQFGSYQSTSNS